MLDWTENTQTIHRRSISKFQLVLIFAACYLLFSCNWCTDKLFDNILNIGRGVVASVWLWVGRRIVHYESQWREEKNQNSQNNKFSNLLMKLNAQTNMVTNQLHVSDYVVLCLWCYVCYWSWFDHLKIFIESFKIPPANFNIWIIVDVITLQFSTNIFLYSMCVCVVFHGFCIFLP